MKINPYEDLTRDMKEASLNNVMFSNVVKLASRPQGVSDEELLNIIYILCKQNEELTEKLIESELKITRPIVIKGGHYID